MLYWAILSSSRVSKSIFWFPNCYLQEKPRLANFSSVLFPGVPARIYSPHLPCREMWPSTCILPSEQEGEGRVDLSGWSSTLLYVLPLPQPEAQAPGLTLLRPPVRETSSDPLSKNTCCRLYTRGKKKKCLQVKALKSRNLSIKKVCTTLTSGPFQLLSWGPDPYF